MLLRSRLLLSAQLALMMLSSSMIAQPTLAQGCQPLGDGCDFRAGKPMTAPLGQSAYPSARVALQPEFAKGTQLAELERALGSPAKPIKPGRYLFAGKHSSVPTDVTAKQIEGFSGYTIKHENRPGDDFVLFAMGENEYLAIEFVFKVPHTRWIQINTESGSFSIHEINCAKLNAADDLDIDFRSNLCVARTVEDFASAAKTIKSRSTSANHFDFYSAAPGK